LDFHRKTAKSLVERFDLIAHEDLNVKGLAGGMLAKSVHDVGWAQFLAILHCKAEEAGVHVIAVDPRGTTSTCSRCGHVEPKSLSQREHSCSMCGLAVGRDHNSALEVLARGLRAVPPSAAEASS
jgi:transposase, IS605 OrfB family, central region